MTQETKYPYHFQNAFVLSISFRRDKKLQPSLELPTDVQIQYVEPGFPRIQVALKVGVPQESPVSFNVEVVGLFEYVGPRSEYDSELNREFVQERALHMLWVYTSNMVRLITSQMGMNPLDLKTPPGFGSLLNNFQPSNKKQIKTRKQKVSKKSS